MRAWIPPIQRMLGRSAFGLALFLLPSTGEATIGLVAGVGGVGGSFAKDSRALKTQGYGFSLEMNWHPDSKGKLWPFHVTAIARQAKLGYIENAIKKTASYNLLGVGLGLYMPFSETLSMNLVANYYPYADLTVLSTNSVRLNNQNFRYSTWEKHSGDAAFEGRLAFTHDKISGGFSKKNRFRSGLGLAFLQQQIKEEELEITTSNDDISPETTSSQRKVSNLMLMYTVDFFIGLTF